MAYYQLTIKEIVDEIAKPGIGVEKMWFYLGDFLDYFYHKDRTLEERRRLVDEEPLQYLSIDEISYAVISATVHKISYDYGLKPVPKWVYNKRYFLQEPYFSQNVQGNLRLVLLRESPKQFRMRHIFTSANNLDRA